MKTTSFSILINQFLRKIEKDRNFFTYYNISEEEALNLAKLQANEYVMEAVDILTDRCFPDIDFYDISYDAENKEYVFNVELTKREIGLLTNLMKEVYFDRDFVRLKAFEVAMTPTDLNQFSPANERNSFTNMVEKIKYENEVRISRYIATDRMTGKPKMINYGSGVKKAR